MGAWLQPEDLAVQHVRQPGQRVPIVRMVAERPLHTRPGHGRLYDQVPGDIIRVVQIDEVVPADGPEDRKGYRGQPEADAHFTTHSYPLTWKCRRKAMRNEGCS